MIERFGKFSRAAHPVRLACVIRELFLRPFVQLCWQLTFTFVVQGFNCIIPCCGKLPVVTVVSSKGLLYPQFGY